jgi:hypothetical protein
MEYDGIIFKRAVVSFNEPYNLATQAREVILEGIRAESPATRRMKYVIARDLLTQILEILPEVK